jgi:N-methylhydantoinase A
VTKPNATIAIDTGGTFTDIVLSVNGRAYVLKVASTPDDPARAAIEGMQQILESCSRALRVSCSPGLLIHGSTVATNALLERKGARVALITNRGFEDVIEIGRQNRPELYALSIHRPPSLVERELRFGISGRLDYRGEELSPLDDAELASLHKSLAGADAVAICLLHSYANARHEEVVKNALRKAGITHISRSSELLPEYREYERTATTVVNAYVTPLMHGYLTRLEQDSDAAAVRIMGSGGGALPVTHARREPVHTVLSGPAGGVSGALAVARAAGYDNIITFDMGGTSTDVSLCPGRPLHTREFTIAGVPVAVPMLDIHTVGAGGGSLAWIDAGGALRVGPRSAGAQPGPICYGRGGTEITVTDANVWLGRLPADAFLGGQQQLRRGLIDQPLNALARSIRQSPEAAAAGVLTVINSTMAGAIRVISVEKGYDPADFTLVAFGGAAGLHAVELAASLSIPRVLLPPHPGVLSAFGMLVSPVRKSTARTVLMRSSATSAEEMEAVFAELERTAVNAMTEEGIASQDVGLERLIDARYAGQSHELRVNAHDWIENLHRAHEARYGYANRMSGAEAVTLRVEATTEAGAVPVFDEMIGTAGVSKGKVYIDSGWEEVTVLPREQLTQRMDGPAIVTEYSATTWVPAGWWVGVLRGGSLILERETT